MHKLNASGIGNSVSSLRALNRWYVLESRGALTVEEYATKHGVGMGRVRQLMREGRIEFRRGERFQVWIDQEHEYPPANRAGAVFRGGKPVDVRAPSVADFQLEDGRSFKDAANLEAYCRFVGLYQLPKD